MMYCKCGCRKQALNNGYARGHHMRNKEHKELTLEVKKKSQNDRSHTECISPFQGLSTFKNPKTQRFALGYHILLFQSIFRNLEKSLFIAGFGFVTQLSF